MNYCLICGEKLMPNTSWATLFTVAQDTIRHCSTCKEQFERISGATCNVCGRISEIGTCFDCLEWGESGLERNIALYTYNEPMKDFMARWKFRGDIVIIGIFRQEIKEVWQKIGGEVDMIVPIPLSKERLYERGFNQAEEIAKLFPIPYTKILTRVHSEKQSKKSRQKRLTGENVFVCEDKGVVKGKRILLVDDIYTTGATLRHGAGVLKRGGAEKVFSVTIAR